MDWTYWLHCLICLSDLSGYWLYFCGRVILMQKPPIAESCHSACLADAKLIANSLGQILHDGKLISE